MTKQVKHTLDFGIYVDDVFTNIESRGLGSIVTLASKMPQVKKGMLVEVRNQAGKVLWESKPSERSERVQASPSISIQILWQMVEGGHSVIEAMRAVIGAELVNRMLDELYEELRKRNSKP